MNRCFSVKILLAITALSSTAFAQPIEQFDPPLLTDVRALRKQFDALALSWISRHPDYPFHLEFRKFLGEQNHGLLDARTSREWISHCDALQDLQGKSILQLIEEFRAPEPTVSLSQFQRLLRGAEFSKELALRSLIHLDQLQKPSPGLSPYLSAALELASELGKPRYLLETNLLAGQQLYRQGSDSQALSFTAKAKELADSTTPESLLQVAFSISGSAHMVLGHRNAAKADFLRVLDSCLKTNRLAEYWAVQSRLAQLDLERGNFLEAESLYSKVYAAAQTTKAERDLALLGLGLCEFNSGKYGKALVKVLPLANDDSVSPRLRAQALYICGLVHHRTGYYDIAEQEFNLSLKLGPDQPGTILLQLASLYWDQGNFDASARAYRQYFSSGSGEKMAMMTPNAVDRIYNLWCSGKFLEAMSEFEQELSGGVPSTTSAKLLWKTGASFAKLGRKNDATRSFQSTLNQAKQLQEPHKTILMVDSLFGLAQLSPTLVDFGSTEELLKIYDSRGYLDQLGVQKLLLLLGESRWQKGEKEQAIADFRSAHDIERKRLLCDLAQGGEQMALLHSTFDGITESKLIYALKSMNRLSEAVEILDDSRGRLLDVQTNLFKKANSIEGGKQLIASIRELSLALGESDLEQSQVTAAKISQLQTQLVELVSPKTQLQGQPKLPGKTSVVLRYAWLSDGLNCFVSTPGKLSVITLAPPTERLNIQEQIEQFRKLVSNRNSSLQACRKVGQDLYAKVVAPLDLSNSADLLISQNDLEFLPFEAIVDESGKYLCEKYTISYGVPGVGRSREGRPLESNRCLVVGGVDFSGVRVPFGRPSDTWDELLGSQRESKVVAALLGTSVLGGREATKQKVLPRLRDAQVIHFATHGYFIPAAVKGSQSPFHFLTSLTGASALDQLVETSLHVILTRSGIVLAANQDGTGGLFTGLDLEAETLQQCKLVVLSCCESGLGVTGLENSSLGLRRAFLKGGAQAVVSSSWKLSDESSVAFMEHFYRELTAGATVSKALNDARRSLFEGDAESNYKHPYYWASLSCYGDPDVQIVGGN